MRTVLLKYRLLFLLLILVNFYTHAQERIQVDTTILNIYNGKISYTEISKTEFSKVRDGKISFNSEVRKKLVSDSIILDALDFTGEYKNGIKQGAWIYTFSKIYLDDVDFKKRGEVTLEHKLNGKEHIYTAGFKNDLRHGKWELKHRDVRNGRYRNEVIKARVNFINDTLKGPFVFKLIQNNTPVDISGTVNVHGFLEGIVTLKYVQEGKRIDEERIYNNGFLISLTKRNSSTKEIIADISYTDVTKTLEEIRKNPSLSNTIKIGTIGFGMKFNNGYKLDDKKITEQTIGNEIVTEAFNSFSILGSIYKNNTEPILKLTRRFEYVYPKYEDSLLQIIKPIAQNLSNNLKELINRPGINLRKENSENLSYNYNWLLHSKQKMDKISDVILKIDEGYFNYRYRDIFYTNGLEGINKIDSVKFNLKGKTNAVEYTIGPLIDKPDSLLPKIQHYLSSLEAALKIKKQEIEHSLIFYENQSYLDSLDEKINTYSLIVQDKYPNSEQYNKAKQDDIPFTYKVLISIEERLLKSLKQKYLNNSGLPIEEVIEHGEKISCLLQFLAENKEKFDDIRLYPRVWNDSLFTEYKDNPFDTRKLESKILPETEQAVNTLLRYYANNLLNSKTCDALQQELSDILKLNQRVIFMAKNYQNENIQLIEKALRRERVPIRIKRILEL